MTSEPQTIAEILDRQAAVLGDARFISCDDEWASYAGLSERSRQVAGGLRRLGLSRGDRVAVLAENSLAFVETFFGCIRLGLVQVPLNIYLRGDFLRYQLEDSGAVVAVVDELGRSAIAALEPPVPLKHLIVIEGSATGGDGALTFSEVADAPPYDECGGLHAGDTAAIVYTSGTTGMPKGCVVPHGQFVHGVHPLWEKAGFIRRGDRVITPTSMFHAGFLEANLPPSLACGASVHSTKRFHASTFMQTAREVEATVIYAVGAIGMLLLAQPPSPQDADPGLLRLALLAPMTPDSQTEFEKRFGITVNCENYGQTECIVISSAGLDEPRQRGSLGRPTENVDVAVVDEQDNPVPPGEVGEIVIRPRKPNMIFKGYWNNPEASLVTYRNLWHHTGDLGRQSPDGTLWFLDRKKDSLRRRGENVSSIELERAIVRHPAVEQAAVHAIGSEMGEDEIKACMVLSSGETTGPDELFAFFKRELPYFAIPRYVEVMDELPVNAAGRIRKQLLRDRGVTPETWDFEALQLSVSREERRGSPGSER